MPKLHIISDLHYEFFENQFFLNVADYLSEVDADCLVVAGDYHRAPWAIEHMRKKFTKIPIVYVAGNHEHYKTGVPVSEDISIIRQDAKNDREQFGRETYFLENESIELCLKGEQVRFIGSTLWTDFELFGNPQKHAEYAKGMMADFISIRSNMPNEFELQPHETIGWHNVSRAFIKSQLEEPFKGKTVVVTHHSPSFRSVADRYKSDPLTPAFSSHCDDLLAMGADLWVHGHTHTSFDYNVGKTRVICNPRGYGLGRHAENRQFQPGFVVDLNQPRAKPTVSG